MNQGDWHIMVMCLRAPRLLFNNTGAAKSKAKALYSAVAVFHFDHQLYGTSATYKTMRTVHPRFAHRPVYGTEGALLVLLNHHCNAALLKLNPTCDHDACMYLRCVCAWGSTIERKPSIQLDAHTTGLTKKEPKIKNWWCVLLTGRAVSAGKAPS